MSRWQRFGHCSRDYLPFFSGNDGTERMNQVRRWILKIRNPTQKWLSNYHKHALLVKKAWPQWKKEWQKQQKVASRSSANPQELEIFEQRMSTLLAHPRNWADTAEYNKHSTEI